MAAGDTTVGSMPGEGQEIMQHSRGYETDHCFRCAEDVALLAGSRLKQYASVRWTDTPLLSFQSRIRILMLDVFFMPAFVALRVIPTSIAYCFYNPQAEKGCFLKEYISESLLILTQRVLGSRTMYWKGISSAAKFSSKQRSVVAVVIDIPHLCGILLL